MAAINPKEYDPSKKIARTVFRGTPNLFTSADINRQIQALQAQLDSLEQKVGVKLTGFDDIWASLNSSAHTFVVKASAYEDDEEGVQDMEVHARGCTFNLGNSTLTSNSLSYGAGSIQTFFVFLKVGNPTLLPYLSDPTHEITGAKFADGSVAEAADQLVYQATPSLVVRNAMYNAEDDEILIAQVIIDGIKNEATVTYNEVSSSAKIQGENWIKTYDKKHIITDITVGTSYDGMLSHLYRSLVPIGTILPFYGEIADLGSAFGWVPCIPIAKGSIGATVSSFTSNELYMAFKELYGNAITFEVVNSAGFSYLRISACRGKTIPDLHGKFLTGASTFSDATIVQVMHYEKGATGGENVHQLEVSELPAHNHGDNGGDTISGGGHTHTYKYRENTNDNTTGLTGPRAVSFDSEYTTGGSGNHSHTLTSVGGNGSHENRPPYHAVYYIMRVC